MKGRRGGSCPACEAGQHFVFEYRGVDYYRCGSCGLVSTYPVPDGHAIEAHYARMFRDGNYRLLRDSMDQYRRVYEGFVRVLAEKCKAHGLSISGLKVLDVGCFTGDFLELLHRCGVDGYGVELQQEAVAIGNQRLPGRIFKGDVYSLGVGEQHFDCVTLLGVIEHVVDPMGILRECHKLLRPGGILMVETPNSGSLLARLLGRYWPPYCPVEHIHLFTRQSMALGLKMTGFADVGYKQHWKKLPIWYVYGMLRNFGPEWHTLLKPLYSLLPAGTRRASLPFYVGEMIVTARRP